MCSERHRRHTAKSLDEIAPPHSVLPDGIVTVQLGIREGVGGVRILGPPPCPLPPSADIGPGGRSVGRLRNAAARFSRLTNGCAVNAVSAFANCGRAVAHVRGSYLPHNQTHAPQQTKRCPHSGRPAAYKARVVISSRSFGPEPRGRAPERRLPCRGFKQGQLLCLAMSADRLSDRFRQSSQISISVPSSTTCLAGTPKKVAEPLALCCRNAKRVSRQTAMPTTSSLGMIFSRPT